MFSPLTDEFSLRKNKTQEIRKIKSLSLQSKVQRLLWSSGLGLRKFGPIGVHF